MIKEIEISKIIIGDRRRKDLGDVASLATSIEQVGLLHPPVVTSDLRLVVGERRIAAFRHLDRKRIPARVVDDFHEAVKLLLAERDENTCRKDFSLSEAVAMGRELEAMEKPKASQREAAGRKKGISPPRSEKFSEREKGRALDKVGEAVGHSRITYSRAKAIVEAAEENPAIAPLVEEMDAKGKVNGTYQKMKRIQAEVHRAKEVAEVNSLHASIRTGDFRKILDYIPDSSIDLIFTDPPYDKGSIPLYGELAKLASRVLKDGGSLVCYCGQYALPEIFPLMAPLRYQWMLAVKHSGGQRRMHGWKVCVGWKPLLWFVKGRHLGEYLRDHLESTPGDKLAHDWAQGCAEARYVIESLCPKGGIVLDPMCGSGTTLTTAARLDRKFLGAEIVESNAKMATKALEELN